MPIVFQPASPVNTQVAQQYGAAEQFNRIYPVLAQLYSQQGRNFTEASAGTARNITQGNIASAENMTRDNLQARQLEYERFQQEQQIAARMQMQAREQQFEAAKMNVAISRQDEMEQARRLNGLAQIEQQQKEGYLTPEQAADAKYELMTGINAFQRRKEYQQNQAIRQQQEMQKTIFAENQKSIALGQQFGKDSAGRAWIPIVQHNGDVDFYGYDAQKGTYYQIGKRTASAQNESPHGPYFDDAGSFSYKKAMPEAKSEAEAAYPPVKGPDGKDINEGKRQEYMQEVLKRMGAGTNRSRTPVEPVGQAAQQPSQPQSVQQSPIDAELAKFKGLNEEQMGHARNVLEGIRDLTMKSQSGQLTDKERADLKILLTIYDSLKLKR